MEESSIPSVEHSPHWKYFRRDGGKNAWCKKHKKTHNLCSCPDIRSHLTLVGPMSFATNRTQGSENWSSTPDKGCWLTIWASSQLYNCSRVKHIGVEVIQQVIPAVSPQPAFWWTILNTLGLSSALVPARGKWREKQKGACKWVGHK